LETLDTLERFSISWRRWKKIGKKRIIIFPFIAELMLHLNLKQKKEKSFQTFFLASLLAKLIPWKANFSSLKKSLAQLWI
jgi:hypothetical protein